MNNTLRLSLSLASVLGSLAAGCDAGNGASTPNTGSSTMTSAIAALEAAVQGCKDQLAVCKDGDAGNAGCQDAFRACKESALGAAMPELEKGAKGCAQESQSCRKAATTEDAKSGCHEELKACVAEHTGHEGDAAAHGGNSPVAACTSGLRSCIESDQEPKLCTDTLRSCLDEALPNHGNGKEEHGDAGNSGQDHGRSDAGKSGEEHGKSDAGKSGGDHGNPNGSDAGVDDGRGMGMANGKACKAELDACVAAGSERKECVRMLACREN